METIVIGVGGMSCQRCVANVRGALQALPGVDRVEVALEAGQATITCDAQKVTVERLRAAIEDAGFDLV